MMANKGKNYVIMVRRMLKSGKANAEANALQGND